jgi:curved DNA-binding protein CbpA
MTLKAAFREAAKANHPDLHPGGPDASIRFGRIGGAYAILRDAEKRAAYDQLLKLEREQLELERKQFGSRSTRIISYTMNTFVFPAIAVAGLAVVLRADIRCERTWPAQTKPATSSGVSRSLTCRPCRATKHWRRMIAASRRKMQMARRL